MSLRKSLGVIERSLRPLRSERGVALSAAGRVVLDKDAPPEEPYALAFTDEEIARLKTIGSVTFTHNHPRGWSYPPHDPRRAGSSFSPEDVLLACRAELAELRAVTPVFTYSLKPARGQHWSEATWVSEIRPLYEVVYSEVKTRLYAATLRGEVNPAEASARLDHEVWSEVARLLGLRYNRVQE